MSLAVVDSSKVFLLFYCTWAKCSSVCALSEYFCFGKHLVLLHYIPKHNVIPFYSTSLLGFIKTNCSLLFWTVEIASSETQEQWTCWTGFTNRPELFICESNWSDCSSSQISNSLIHQSNQNDSKWAKHRNIRAWACVRPMLIFTIDYCKWKSFLGHDCQLFVD